VAGRGVSVGRVGGGEGWEGGGKREREVGEMGEGGVGR